MQVDGRPILVFLSSGFGDGQFPIYQPIDETGRVGVEIEFIASGPPRRFSPRLVRENNERVIDTIQNGGRTPTPRP